MIDEATLLECLTNDTPSVLIEQCHVSIFDTAPPLCPTAVKNHENTLLARHTAKPSFITAFFTSGEKRAQWRKFIALVFPSLLAHGKNPKWVEIGIDNRYVSMGEDPVEVMGAMLITSDNHLLFEVLCRHPKAIEMPQLHQRWLARCIQHNAIDCFAFLFEHLKKNQKVYTLAPLYSQAVMFGFTAGVQHLLSKTPKRLLPDIYRSSPDFYELGFALTPTTRAPLLLLLQDGELGKHVTPTAWVSVGKKILAHKYTLLTSQIVYLKNATLDTELEDIVFTHPSWDGQRMEWLASLLRATPSFASVSWSNKFVLALVSHTTAVERTQWLKSAEKSVATEILSGHPLVQNALLHSSLDDIENTKDETTPRKI